MKKIICLILILGGFKTSLAQNPGLLKPAPALPSPSGLSKFGDIPVDLHTGALDNPTPNNTLYINASKLDFGDLTTSQFPSLNTTTPQNLLTGDNFFRSVGNERLRGTVYALGRVDMQLIDREHGLVKIVNNSATDYDWNNGGGTIRNTLIDFERWRADLDTNSGFKAYFYGIGKLSTPSIFNNTGGVRLQGLAQ
ncbi:hypothetical protein ACTJJ0_04755 [Chitinophaga sp. 22321]|uniref:Uncharacterized protein n=1 Tax=Chitinophaga hostae TaxID=2831022 RepID=A0ABS5IYA0_9BACT|nr:hypothetical protein [Chitinophaga hostae]MBS0027949.1 hypothetical protein [Chitinophaga hostae]